MSFTEELSEYRKRHALNADDRAHLKRWARHIMVDADEIATWDELPDPELIIDYALEARKEAKGIQANAAFLKLKSQKQRKDALEIADYAEAIAKYYRSQPPLPFTFGSHCGRRCGR
jgi:hypothetical protein